MINVTNVVGRLVEIRVMSRPTLQELESQGDPLLPFRGRFPGGVLVVADLTRGSVMPPEHAEHFAGTLRREASYVARSGLLVASNSTTLGLQMTRVAKAADVEDRHQVFVDVAALKAWMAPVLTPAEAARLSQFLER